MTDRGALTAPRIQDYIDGRLSPEERAAVEAELPTDPALKAAVERLRRDTELLQAMGQDVLEEPVPEALRAVLRGAKPRDRGQ